MSWLSDEAAAHWDAAASGDESPNKRALSFWAHHKKLLPGPLYFTLGRRQLLSQDWRRIVNHSQARCRCGMQRWFIPPTSQEVFYEPPENEWITIGPHERYVAITPWGGKTESTSIQLSVVGGQLRQQLMPYSHFSRAQLASLGVGLVESGFSYNGLIFGSPVSAKDDFIDLETMAAKLKVNGSPAMIPLHVRLGLSPNNLELRCFYPYGIYEVGADGTVVIGISRNYKRTDPANRGPYHKCS
jgi:hypothetical protein